MRIFLLLSILSYALWRTHEPLSGLLIRDFLKPLTLSAEVVSLVQRHQCYQSFTLRPLDQKYYIQAHWFACQALEIQVGDILKLGVILKPWHAMHNPGSAESVVRAQAANIVAHATIKSVEKIGVAHGLSLNIQRLREHLAVITQQHLAPFTTNPNVSAVLNSLTLGMRDALSWETVQDFTLSGTRHLLAISGAHVAIVATLAYGIFFNVLRLLIPLRPTLNAHTLALGMAALWIAFYVSISGEQLPTLRALCMAGLGCGAIFLQRYSSFLYRTVMAASVILFLEPAALYSPSFYLSFCAVWLIGYHLAWRISCGSKVKNYLQFNFLLLLGLCPISLYFFSQYSALSLLFNIISIPWIMLVILPCTIFAQWWTYFSLPCAFLWHSLAWMTHYFLTTLHFFAHITQVVPGAWITGHLSVTAALVLFPLILLFFLPRGAPGRPLVMLALGALFLGHPAPSPEHAEIIVMNVGQGLAVLIKTQHHLLVYDTGPKFFGGGDVAQTVLLPYFYYRGWKKIDLLMVSHGDADHAGGVDTLRKYFTITRIVTSAIHKIPQSILCQRGQHWRWDAIEFSVIYPDAAHQGKNNNSSCVLKISAGTQHVLLTGDIEKSAEYYLAQFFPEDVVANVLSVPHHGSKTSSSERFLGAVHPQYAIFSYGFLNRFHFPHPDVMQRYGQKKIVPFITESGPVTVQLSAAGITIFS